MLTEGSSIYLGLDDPSGGRVLHAGIIAAIAQDHWTIEFENSELPIRTGDARLVYYHHIKAFVQRHVHVEEQSRMGSRLRVVMKVSDDAIPSDTRQEFRVSVIDAGLTATLDTEEGCAVQDISMSGFGVVSDREYSIGQTLDATLHSEDEDFSGRVEVQCVRQIDAERARYGLRGLFEAKGGDSLQGGLMRMIMGIHRQHLRRISGTS